MPERSAAEMRVRLLERLETVMNVTGMCALDGYQAESTLRWLLQDLCFLDGRDDAASAIDVLIGSDGPLGISGWFERSLGPAQSYAAEVASVMAQRAHELGYLPLTGPVGRGHEALLARGAAWLRQAPRRRRDVELEFGPPSRVVDHRVGCYAPGAGPGEWVFVDYAPVDVTDPVSRDRDRENPWVRDIRLPAVRLSQGLVLAPARA